MNENAWNLTFACSTSEVLEYLYRKTSNSEPTQWSLYNYLNTY